MVGITISNIWIYMAKINVPNHQPVSWYVILSFETKISDKADERSHNDNLSS
jgi:hypothetical protein